MKRKIIALLAISMSSLCFSNTASAQDTSLVMTRAFVYDIPAGGSLSITVPAARIWRVESVSMGASGTAPGVFLKNASAQSIAYFSSPANSASAAYPFWLSTAFSGSFVNNNPSYRCSVSITEFTVKQ